MAAFRTYVEVALDFLAKRDLLAGRTLGPDVVAGGGSRLSIRTRGIGLGFRVLRHRSISLAIGWRRGPGRDRAPSASRPSSRRPSFPPPPPRRRKRHAV